jgi:hypothetical protein
MNEKGMRRFVEILEKMMVLMAAVSAVVQGNDQPLDSLPFQHSPSLPPSPLPSAAFLFPPEVDMSFHVFCTSVCDEKCLKGVHSVNNYLQCAAICVRHCLDP